MCRKKSISCFSALLFDRHLEMYLLKGSVLCICCSACNLSLVSSFGMMSGVSETLVTSGVTVSVSGCAVRFCCHVALCSSVSGGECGSILNGGR